jgi:RNA polymerase sigma-54 factor
MKLQMTGQLRLEQHLKLAPHMIQSMEILQLSILALQERIEQELISNPVLEVEEPADSDMQSQEQSDQDQPASADTVSQKDGDFEKINALDDDYRDYLRMSQTFHKNASDETDKKLEALKNTEAAPLSLHEYLSEQFGLVEADEKIKKAGQLIIDYIDDRGYLTVRLEQLVNHEKNDFTLEDLNQALGLVQKLDPVGVGARDARETLLIQMENSSEDYSFEKKLVAEHIDQLLENRLPEIAKKMRCSIEQINKAIERISRFDTSPGLQIGKSDNMPVTADVIIEEADTPEGFTVRLADVSVPTLKISDYYFKLAKDPKTNEKAKQFLQNNIRSARWIIDAIQQRNNTLLKVTTAIVKYQRPFFEKGQLYLKPLPMSTVAKDIGVHLATVSRAVAGKYVQCSAGILPLRKFFSGGTEDTEGNAHSWQAVRAKLQQIIDSEDKTRPLSDDQIKAQLAQAGLNNIARRTVAKYRKLLNIPAARFRKRF